MAELMPETIDPIVPKPVRTTPTIVSTVSLTNPPSCPKGPSRNASAATEPGSSPFAIADPMVPTRSARPPMIGPTTPITDSTTSRMPSQLFCHAMTSRAIAAMTARSG
jgi:hypothetical protein